MDIVASILALTGILGAVLARWTRLHPLLVGALVALPAGLLALLVAAGAMSPAALGFGGIGWLIAAVAGSLGAFVGWLRREHLERRR